MFDRTSLRTRIFVGFTIIVVLLVANAAIAFLGARLLKNANEELHRATRLNEEAISIDRDIQVLRLRVNRYIASGYASLRDDVIALSAQLEADMAVIPREDYTPDIRSIFDRMDGFLAEYARQFATIVEERELRAELVRERLPAITDEISELLSSLAAESEDSTQVPATVKVALLQCESELSQSERHFLRYYESPDSLFANQAVTSIHEALEHALALQSLSPEDPRSEALVTAIREFERIGLRAVQATRSYLFLVNVVMAGEASEVAYYSNQLREASQRRQEEISAQLASIQANVNRMTGTGVVVALALALFISGRLALSITRPISALTSTFRKLAAGASAVEVPETERSDEIGEMAKAAGVFRDQNQRTTELLEQARELSDSLHAKTQELESSNADLDSFAYVASHDLKSPLRGLRQLARWIEEDSGHLLEAESARHLADMRERIQRMETLLQDLLNYSRAGRRDSPAEDVDVAELLSSATRLVDNPKDVAIEWQDDMPQFTTFRIPLEQVFLNLIGNAVKHNRRTSDGQVSITWNREDGFYIFRVADNGPGIDPYYHERIFQMYQRVADQDVEGTGMGLAIVKKQIERLGGRITVDSEPDHGATFEFSWPVTIPPDDTENE